MSIRARHRQRLHTGRNIAYAVAALTVLTLTGCAAWRIQRSVALARESEPFQRAPEGARARMLVIGDSTAVGTGARVASAARA